MTMKERYPTSAEEWQGLYVAKGLQVLARSIVVGVWLLKGYQGPRVTLDDLLAKLDEVEK